MTDAGTPTWWYTMAPAVLTFLTTNDFAGKTVIPFMTNGGWPGHVIKDMKEKCKGANFMHEMQIRFDSMGKDHLETPESVIDQWIEQIKDSIVKIPSSRPVDISMLSEAELNEELEKGYAE